MAASHVSECAMLTVCRRCVLSRPASFCVSMHVNVAADSEICREVQMAKGCHDCGRAGCWSTSSACDAKSLQQENEAHRAPVYAPTLYVVPVSNALQRYAAEKLSPVAGLRCQLRSVEAGGGGDCLFHSFAAALESMLHMGDRASQHVLGKVRSDVFTGGKPALVRHVRRLAAETLSESL